MLGQAVRCATDAIAQGIPLQVLLAAAPKAAAANLPWIDRYLAETVTGRPSSGRPDPKPVRAPVNKRDEHCPVHPGGYVGNCGGCRADALVGDQ